MSQIRPVCTAVCTAVSLMMMMKTSSEAETALYLSNNKMPFYSILCLLSPVPNSCIVYSENLTNITVTLHFT